MRPEPELLDALLTWIGAIGVFRYMEHLRRDRQGSGLERRLAFLLGCLGFLLFVRGFDWLHPMRTLQILTCIPATLVPLAMLLFVEGLLRRHLPLWVKVFVASGAVALSVANLAGWLYDHRGWELVFLAYEIATLLILGGFLVLRRRASLSPAENRLVDIVALAVVCTLPLCATDFHVLFGHPPIRMGALAALIFVYVCARDAARRNRGPILYRDIARMALRTLALGAVLFVLTGSERSLALPCAAIAFGLVLVFVTWDRLWVLSEQTGEHSFLRWLAEARTQSLAEFLEALRECPAAGEHVVLQARDLSGYDAELLAARLAEAGGVLGRATIARAAQRSAAAPREDDEQLAALLETHGTSHACLAGVDPPVLLLLNHPGLADASVTELEIALVQKFATLARHHDVAAARAT